MCGNIRVDVCGRGVEVRDLCRSVWKCVAVCVSRVGDVWVSGGCGAWAAECAAGINVALRCSSLFCCAEQVERGRRG